MPRGNKRGKKGKKRSGGNSGRPTWDVSGMLQGVGIPVPRLPFLIGSATSLGADNTVYPKLVKLDFPIIPQFLSIVAGDVATTLSVDANALTQLATDFYALFEEYCLVGAVFEIRMNNVAVPAGLVLVYIDEKNDAAPVSAEALGRPHIEALVQNTESPSRHLVSWKARDYLDLQWSETATAGATPAIPVYLKVFSSVAATGTTATTTGQVCITGSLSMCFRGYAQ